MKLEGTSTARKQNWVKNIALIGLGVFILAALAMVTGGWSFEPEYTQVRKEIKL